MRKLFIPASFFLVWVVVSPLAADEKPGATIDAKKLVGNWEGKPAVDLGKDAKSFVEFSADGAVKMGVTSAAVNLTSEGKYTLEGTKLSFAMKKPKESNSEVTITKLTDNDLEWRNADDVVITFKRAKVEKK